VNVVPNESAEDLARFGVRDGLPLRNKEAILEETWKKLGRTPKIVYGLCERGSPYGHAFAAVERFNPASGKAELMVANIIGTKGSGMVQWIPLGEYLYGVNDFKGANRQRSAYNRSFTLFALHGEHLDPKAMVRYFEDLAERNERGEAKFDLALPRVRNLLHHKVLRDTSIEFGNCARWTAEALRVAGVFDGASGLRGVFQKNTPWPKRIGIRLLDGRTTVNREDIDVIAVPRIGHAVKTARAKAEGTTYANPATYLAHALRVDKAVGLFTDRPRRLSHLSSHAALTHVVPPGSMTAEIIEGPPPSRRVRTPEPPLQSFTEGRHVPVPQRGSLWDEPDGDHGAVTRGP
jgi:hypothetical protein